MTFQSRVQCPSTFTSGIDQHPMRITNLRIFFRRKSTMNWQIDCHESTLEKVLIDTLLVSIDTLRKIIWRNFETSWNRPRSTQRCRHQRLVSIYAHLVSVNTSWMHYPFFLSRLGWLMRGYTSLRSGTLWYQSILKSLFAQRNWLDSTRV